MSLAMARTMASAASDTLPGSSTCRTIVPLMPSSVISEKKTLGPSVTGEMPPAASRAIAMSLSAIASIERSSWASSL